VHPPAFAGDARRVLKPSNSTELGSPTLVDDALAIAMPCPPPEQGEVTVTRLDGLQAENAALREQVDDLKADLRELLAENEDIDRIIEADDRLKVALAKVARYEALAENAERTLTERTNEFNERARNVAYWKNRAEKGEKLLQKALSEAKQFLRVILSNGPMTTKRSKLRQAKPGTRGY